MIKKALIPAAGFGTRFLPQTKAMPKEMMPLVDKPIIQRVVEELVDAGIETIVIVTGWNKRSIEDHFDNHFELEEKLARAGKEKELEMVRKISDMAEFIYVRQKGPVGNATPILNSRHIMGDKPFMLFWGDDFIDANPSRAKQLMEAYNKYKTMIIGGLRIDTEDGYEESSMANDSPYKKYGFVGGEEVNSGILRVNKVVEKPGNKEAAPSNLASISGFVITCDIYEHLEKAKDNLKEEEELGYLMGIQRAIDAGVPVYALELKNAVYRDTGNKLEYLKTVVEYGLKHEEIGKDFTAYLQKVKSDLPT